MTTGRINQVTFFVCDRPRSPRSTRPFGGGGKAGPEPKANSKAGCAPARSRSDPLGVFFSKKGFSKVRSYRGARSSLGKAQIIDSFVLFLDNFIHNKAHHWDRQAITHWGFPKKYLGSKL
jgi:hypothetical protein